MDKAYSTDSVKGVNDGLHKDHQFRKDQINEEGIDEALQTCNGNVQRAIVYYVEQHFNGEPGYSRDADTSDDDSSDSDEEYYNQPAKRRRTGPNTKYAPTKYTNKGSTRNNEPNNKPSTTGSCNGKSQGLGDSSRKRKAEEGKFKIRYVV